MNQENKQEILSGLLQPEKRISSKYFYDDTGSRIFQEIMKMPEYYLTDSEFEIFCEQSNQIIDELKFSGPLNVVEFGAGDGSKTLELLKSLVKSEVEVTYVPIDISAEAIGILHKRIKASLPELTIAPKIGDYFELLSDNPWNANATNLYLFLGSNIGNYPKQKAINLLGSFNQTMRPGDGLLIGVDLKKDPEIIYKAYFDPHGITKRFNLNLLHRFNRELAGNFNPIAFDFKCEYNEHNGEIRSYLVSLEDQKVSLLDYEIGFYKGERIWTELSKKYTFQELELLAQESGFVVKKHFLDRKKYFTNTLWIKPD